MRIERKLAIVLLVFGIIFIYHGYIDAQKFNGLSTIPNYQFCGDSVPDSAPECVIFFATQAIIFKQKMFAFLLGTMFVVSSLVLFFHNRKH